MNFAADANLPRLTRIQTAGPQYRATTRPISSLVSISAVSSSNTESTRTAMRAENRSERTDICDNAAGPNTESSPRAIWPTAPDTELQPAGGREAMKARARSMLRLPAAK